MMDEKISKKRKKKKCNKVKKFKRSNNSVYLDSDEFDYIRRVFERCQEPFEDLEEKKIFINNVIEQIALRLGKIASNECGSWTLEKLLDGCLDCGLEKEIIIDIFYKEFSGDNLRLSCSDKFASRVLEKLIKISALSFLKKDENSQAHFDYLIGVSRFCINNSHEFILEESPNFVLRACLMALTECAENNIEIKSILKNYGNWIIAWPHLNDCVNSNHMSACLQIILRSLEKFKNCQRAIQSLTEKFYCVKKIKNENNVVENCVNYEEIPNFVNYSAALRLLETLIEIADTKRFLQIWHSILKIRISNFLQIDYGNFVVEKLLKNCKDKFQFQEMYEEIIILLDIIYEKKYYGLILQLAESCREINVKQGDFINALMKTMSCYAPENRQKSIILSLLQLKKYEDLQDLTSEMGENIKNKLENSHAATSIGSRLVQSLLQFKKPIKIVNSLLALSTSQLMIIFTNKMGSYVADVFMTSKSVGEKKRDYLFQKFTGSFSELAKSKFGSRSLEAMWYASSIKDRTQIMEELIQNETKLNFDDFGKILINKFGLKCCKGNKSKWIALQDGNKSKTKIKEEFLEMIM